MYVGKILVLIKIHLTEYVSFFFFFPHHHQIFFFFLACTFNNFYFTTGQRSSVKLVYNGYNFVKFMQNSRGTKWICATRSSTKCRARVRTTKDSKLEVLFAEHNHSLKQSKYKFEGKSRNSSISDVKQNIE
ncbi:uncharacterized protein LOC131995130 [Stomoxys calcitrans]|uniref:uncharacterized protein LOC131995130 n=1 Tax=Stomoxys calcitrans TaxID=35570 RepID=UPI0027E2C8E7|nr:uncharacterized protein LOC131995130 [Stomoxys calcitrans]